MRHMGQFPDPKANAKRAYLGLRCQLYIATCPSSRGGRLLTDSDGYTDSVEARLETLLIAGEGALVEYKSSLRWDYRQENINKELTKVAVQVLCSFLNSKGGSLVIGVNDDGEILGLDRDFATLRDNSRDKFELTLRDAISNHLGPYIDPLIDISFADVEGNIVAIASCKPHDTPVYFSDGNDTRLIVRAGNLKRSLDIKAGLHYIQTHWPPTFALTPDSQEVISAAVQAALATQAPKVASSSQRGTMPIWLDVSTKKVLDLYLRNLSRAHSWRRLYIISPWISNFGESDISISFDQLLHRLKHDNATAYVVTRPPEDQSHKLAIESLAETGRASIALLPELHTKLFTADTVQSSFAMLGSANFTKNSFANRELGILIKSTGDGARIVQDLEYEAAEIYRHPERNLLCKATL